MTVDVLVMTDGRLDYLAATMASLRAQVLPSLEEAGQLGRLVLHDDSGDPAHKSLLVDTYPEWGVIGARRRSGFGGAYRDAWRWCGNDLCLDGEFLFSTEDDFMFNRPVDVPAMARVLQERPELAQLALRRQPWNAAEKAAGGVVELNPDAYVDRWSPAGDPFLEHRLFWTTNPSLHRRQLCQVGWPAGAQSEGRWAHQLLAQGLPWGVPGDQVRFGYWGERGDGPWVDHIGHVRAGGGY